MKRSTQLRNTIATTIQEVRDGTIGPAVGSAIARLADVEVKSVVAEISYLKNKSTAGSVDFFEESANQSQTAS